MKTFNLTLFLFAILLALIGLANLYSATVGIDTSQMSDYFKAQLLYTFIGIGVMFLVSFFSVEKLFALAPYIYGISLILLGLVLVMGATSHGAQSWLNVGGVHVQPSEFGKFGLVLMLARYLASLQKDGPMSFGEIFVAGVFFLMPTALVVLQNDLGSSLFYGFIFGSLIFIQGLRIRFIIVSVLLVCVVAVVCYSFLLQPYQKNRIISFMKPELDPRGSGYHLVQSKIAVGSGGMTGKGYLKGESHRLKFLPERHTDFVFPVLAEEWGFVGGVVTLIIYFLFLMMGMNVVSCATTRFGFFLTTGIVATFFWHLVINLGGVLGLLPLTGVPLPFLSYGGSSLVANWMGIGFLLSVYRSSMKR